jgi:phosphatidate phosphatase PAH1
VLCQAAANAHTPSACPQRRQVRITVNDEEIPFYMKVGETGEAFFVFETDGNVPEDLQTSPLSSPISNETADEEAPGVSYGGACCRLT